MWFTNELSPVFSQLNILPPGSLGEALTDHQESKSGHVPKVYIRCVWWSRPAVFAKNELKIRPQGRSLRHRADEHNFQKAPVHYIGGKRYSASHINHHHHLCICMARWNKAVYGRIPDVDATISTVSYDPYLRPLINEYIAWHSCFLKKKSQPAKLINC